MGSAQRDAALVLARALNCPVPILLSASSWSLLTASNEKVSPFSWKERQMLNKDLIQSPVCWRKKVTLPHQMVCSGSVPDDWKTLALLLLSIEELQEIYLLRLVQLQMSIQQPEPGQRWRQVWPSWWQFPEIRWSVVLQCILMGAQLGVCSTSDHSLLLNNSALHGGHVTRCIPNGSKVFLMG